MNLFFYVVMWFCERAKKRPQCLLNIFVSCYRNSLQNYYFFPHICKSICSFFAKVKKSIKPNSLKECSDGRRGGRRFEHQKEIILQNLEAVEGDAVLNLSINKVGLSFLIKRLRFHQFGNRT